MKALWLILALAVVAILVSLVVYAEDKPEIVPVPREILEQLVMEHKAVLQELDLYRRALELCRVKSGCV